MWRCLVVSGASTRFIHVNTETKKTGQLAVLECGKVGEVGELVSVLRGSAKVAISVRFPLHELETRGEGLKTWGEEMAAHASANNNLPVGPLALALVTNDRELESSLEQPSLQLASEFGCPQV